MPARASDEQTPRVRDEPFNSLFEMRGAVQRVEADAAAVPFNSLFEMLCIDTLCQTPPADDSFQFSI